MSSSRIYVTAEQLNLGDIVRLGGDDIERLYGVGAFMDAIVKRIDNDESSLTYGVVVERPYMQSEDFSYTGGVIVYTGHEDIVLSFGSAKKVILVQKGRELK